MFAPSRRPAAPSRLAHPCLQGVDYFVLALLVGALLVLAPRVQGADLFGGSALLEPAVALDGVDLEATRAWPGDVAVPPGVLRLKREGNHSVWSTAKVEAAGPCHFVLAYRQVEALGSVLFVGDFALSVLRPDAALDPADEASWLPVPYAGEPGRQVRLVALPPGTRTRAVRLSGLGELNGGGSYARSVALFTALRERLVNVAPAARLRVSTSAEIGTGFRPNLRVGDASTLLDGTLEAGNWSTLKRKTPIAEGEPEWVMLDFQEPRALDGVALLFGGHDSGAGQVLVQRYDGVGDGTPNARDPRGWTTIATLTPQRPWRPPLVWESIADLESTVRTRALRLLLPAGLQKAQAAGGEGANPNAVEMGEVLVLQALGPDAAVPAIRRPAGPAAGVVPITFTLPEAGIATLRIVDEAGQVVQNMVSGERFAAGTHTVYWDLATLDDYWPPYTPDKHGYKVPPEAQPVAAPGNYRWEGVWHPPLELEFQRSFYPLKDHGVAWVSADRTGGWLADHTPPRTVQRVGDRMWVGTFCEAGDAILEADLEMRKLWGSNRIWLACPRVMTLGDDGMVYFLEQGGWAKKLVLIQVNPATKSARRLCGREIDEKVPMDIAGLAVIGGRAYIADRAANTVEVLDLAPNLAAKPQGFGWDVAWKLGEGEQMHSLRRIAVPRPGRMRPTADGKLALVSGDSVALLDPAADTLTPVVTGLTNPMGLAVDEAGQYYVGELTPSHQVKVFGPDGVLRRVVGKPGPHVIGPFDPDNLESPIGLDVDAAGNLWVCEANGDLKRTSVWGPDGRLVHQVVGPTVYGGGGDIDPRDENHYFYQGKEFRRDPATDQITLTRLLWRGHLEAPPAPAASAAAPAAGDDHSAPAASAAPAVDPAATGGAVASAKLSVDTEGPQLLPYDLFFTGAAHNFGGAAPAYPFYAATPRPGAAPATLPADFGSTLYFTSWQGWAAGGNTTLWRLDETRQRLWPVAAIGTPPDWLRERFPAAAKDAAAFAWTDRNDDGRVDAAEVAFTPLTLGGKAWDRVGATWQFRLNRHFEAAASDAKYGAAAIAFFRVAGFTERGYPLYTLPSAFVEPPIPGGLRHSADAVFTDAAGNAIALDEYLYSLAPDGTLNWRYKSLWPGLHRGHATTAAGTEPGLLIAPTRFLGSAWVSDAVGEVLCIGGNLGTTYLFTADGFYLDRVFQDVRVGLAWRQNRPPTPDVLAQLSLGDEHFGGTFQRVDAADGTAHIRYVVGQPHSSIIELRGLDRVARLPGGAFTVTPAHLVAAEALQRDRAAAAAETRQGSIVRLGTMAIDGRRNDWPKDAGAGMDGFALGYDATSLYLWYQGSDDRAPFHNAATAETWLEAFKHGDVVDVMLATRPGLDLARTTPGVGDLRLSIAEVDGQPTAILYDYVVPGTDAAARVQFASPWRSLPIDVVRRLPAARIAVERGKDSFSLEAAIPLADLGLDPRRTPTLRGDVGRVHSDQTGGRAVARVYWSNKATNITADLPSEAAIVPALWGWLRFDPAPDDAQQK